MVKVNAPLQVGSDWDPSSAVYSPSEVSTYGVKHVEEMRDGKAKAVRFPISGIDSYFAPLLPGQVCGIIAQTSNMKSGFMHFWERQLARQLTGAGRKEVIVHISVEEGVEEQALLAMQQESGQDAAELMQGNVESWEDLRFAATRLMDIPIWRVGDSVARAEYMPQLHLSNIMRSLKAMKESFDEPVEIAAIFLDYIQALPFDPEIAKTPSAEQRRLQVRSDVYRCRQMAALYRCPCIIAIQAKQQLAGRPHDGFDLPGTYDGEETSSIAQRLDRVWSQWLVKTTKTPDDTVEFGGKEIKVSENLMFGRVCKQRGRLPAGRIFPLFVDYARNQIAMWDL